MAFPRLTQAAVVLIGVLAACGPYARTGNGTGGAAGTTSDPVARTSPDTMEQLHGKLFVTGSEPMTAVTLQRADGGAITLTGSLEPELRRLSGATVAVHGALTEHPPRGGFDVQRYEVLRIDGERPHVGTLIVRNDSTWLATGSDTVRLTAVPEALRTQGSAKVWLIGPITDQTLHVQSYGIIRARDGSMK